MTYKTSVLYANELIRLSEAENNYTYLHRGYLQKGMLAAY
jgi:hypothetical protein